MKMARHSRQAHESWGSALRYAEDAEHGHVVASVNCRFPTPGGRSQAFRAEGAGIRTAVAAAGSGAPVIQPPQQPGDRLGVAVVAERGIDMIKEAGAERRRIDGLPGERVGSCLLDH